MPLWVLSALVGMLLLVLFAGFNHALHSDSDPVFLALGKLDVPTVEVPHTPPLVAERPLSLRILSADEIDAHRVEIINGPRGRTETIVIQGDSLFRSGRASINKQLLSLLEAIGEALRQLPGKILVTGHTDSVPIRTLKFPSNQVLSARRARNVADRLGKVTGQPEQFHRQGAGGQPATGAGGSHPCPQPAGGNQPAAPGPGQLRVVDLIVMPTANRTRFTGLKDYFLNNQLGSVDIHNRLIC